MSLVERTVLSDPGLRLALTEGETPLAYATAAPTDGASRDEPLGVTPTLPAPQRGLAQVLM